VILLHDNAQPHTAILTKEKLKEFHWETLKHPPYSPDLSPQQLSFVWATEGGIGRTSISKR
jgi:transposase